MSSPRTFFEPHPSRLIFTSAFALAASCGGPETAPELDDASAEIGAQCTNDAGCETWEYCSVPVCIRAPCDFPGTCAPKFNFQDSPGLAIPDNNATGIRRTLSVGVPNATVESLSAMVNIEHTYRGDLIVKLRAPDGREHVLTNKAGGSADNFVFDGPLSTFAGAVATGDWTLSVVDAAAADVGRLVAWRLVFAYASAPTPPTEDPTVDVWAGVEAVVESAHPYTNGTNRTWDLRPWTGGAEKVRIHFAQIGTEKGYDFVDVLDGAGKRLLRFDGSRAAFTTGVLATSDLRVRLTSDGSITGYGFKIDRIEVFGVGCLADSECAPDRYCPVTRVCAKYPCFQTCEPKVEEPPPVELCREGDSMTDGCNVCSCSNNAWRCTERACMGTAGLGEACGQGVACVGTDTTLECDYGPTEAANACTLGDRQGICVESAFVHYCRAVYMPVCACNGQTFPNDCSRLGVEPWAHDGACTLDLAIPDNDATGVRTSIDLASPGARAVTIDVKITHTYRGDLRVSVIAPNGAETVLSNLAGGSADDFEYTGGVDADARGTWTLVVSDRAAQDVGKITFFNVMPHY